MRCGCCAIALVATLHLTSACHVQDRNKITSLDGVVFPAGLTTLYLVSFHDGRLCFVVFSLCSFVMLVVGQQSEKYCSRVLAGQSRDQG